jgi:hypothetical protein
MWWMGNLLLFAMLVQFVVYTVVMVFHLFCYFVIYGLCYDGPNSLLFVCTF